MGNFKKKIYLFYYYSKKLKFTNVEFPHIPKNAKIYKYKRI